MQVLEDPSSSAEQGDARRATDALFGHVLQGPKPLPQPEADPGPTGTGHHLA